MLISRSAEQDITGDVLLELNLELLKTEIGIIAFGKRKRISNAIAELRRPAVPQTPHSESLFSHSRSVSSAQGSSLNSLSLPSSAPPAFTTGSATFGGFYHNDSPRIKGDASSLSPDTPKSISHRRGSDPDSIQENVETLNRTSSRNSFFGLGTNKFQVIAVRGET